jgi:hypothetical protein
MKDLFHLVDTILSIAAAAYSDDNTEVAVDIQGFNAAIIEIHIGVGGITFTSTNKIEFKLTHSDDNSSYSAVTVDDMIGLSNVGTGGIIKSLTTAHAAGTVERFGYRGGKRYLKLLADFGGTHSSPTPLAASIVKLEPHQSLAA